MIRVFLMFVVVLFIKKDDVITYMVYISKEPNETKEALEGLFEGVVR